MADLAFDLVLCALILGAALAAVAGRGLFRAVVFFIVYGVFIAMAWLRLGAIDVALAEAAIGAGLTGVLLLGAVARAPTGGAETGLRPIAALVAGAAAVLLGWGYATMPLPEGLTGAVAENLGQAGAANPVTAVLLNFRGWDTLLESIVLLAALLGVWALGDDAGWGGRPGVLQHVRPGGVLAQFGRVLPPVGFAVGAYLVWAGTKQPGGAFQGGTVLAAVGLLVAMAGLIRAPRLRSRPLRLGLIAGPAVFLAVGITGALAGQFLYLPPEHAGAIILGVEVVLTLSIALTLALLVLGRPEGRG